MAMVLLTENGFAKTKNFLKISFHLVYELLENDKCHIKQQEKLAELKYIIVKKTDDKYTKVYQSYFEEMTDNDIFMQEQYESD